MEPVEELRALLHRAVDLLCDELARGRRRALPRAGVVHTASELDVAYANQVLKRAGGTR